MRLKIILLAVGILTICSCGENEKESNPVEFYYIRCFSDIRKGFKIDTIPTKGKDIIGTLSDSLFLSREITIYGNSHTLKKYSNVHHAPVDGEYTYYELDSLGVIFYTLITWESYGRLYSNNDSINKIIDLALLKALSEDEYKFRNHFINDSTRQESILDFRNYVSK